MPKFVREFKEEKDPEWLKGRLGYVSDRIGPKGFVQIHKWKRNKVILKLIKEDKSFELLPASIALSEEIADNKITMEEVKNCEIYELSGGYVCISIQQRGFTVEELRKVTGVKFSPPLMPWE